MRYDKSFYRPGTKLTGGTHPVEFISDITPQPADRSSIGPGTMVIKEQAPVPVRYGQPQAGLEAVLKSYDDLTKRLYKVRDAVKAIKGR